MMLLNAGIDNLSCDLMYGIPGQTTESLESTLTKVCALPLKHISAYGLKIEENTPFYEVKDELDIADDDEQMDMYELTVGYLAEKGFKQYEISNFAKEGYKSRHNLKYWNADEYLGLGCAAHSYLKGRRFSNFGGIHEYLKGMKDGGKVIKDVTEVTDLDRINEYVMLKLRLNEGIDEKQFYIKFGMSFDSAYAEQILRFTESGHMKYDNGRYFLTLKGFCISNYILCEFLNI